MLIRDSEWNKIRDQFTEAEKPHPYWEKHPAQKAQMLMDRAQRGES